MLFIFFRLQQTNDAKNAVIYLLTHSTHTLLFTKTKFISIMYNKFTDKSHSICTTYVSFITLSDCNMNRQNQVIKSSQKNKVNMAKFQLPFSVKLNCQLSAISVNVSCAFYVLYELCGSDATRFRLRLLFLCGVIQ